MNETEIRDRLADLAADAPHAITAPPKLLRRARHRVVLTVASSVAVVLVLVGAGVAGVRAIGRGDAKPAVQPSVGPTVESSGGMFANVHGWIAYRSGSEIMAVNPANPRDTVALDEPSTRHDPIGWSRDGTQLLLTDADPDEVGDLVVVHADGSRTTLVSGDVGWGSFSPDGISVTYAVSGGTVGGVYVIDAVDGNRLIAEERDPAQCGQSAAWSPDGRRIAFTDFLGPYGPTCHRSPYGVSIVNADGTGLRTAVVDLPLGLGLGGIAWSPDGSQLVFWGTFQDSGGDNSPGQVFVVNVGGWLQQITNDGDNRWPTWSPDGSRIAFVHDGALYTMAPDGTDMHEVTGVHPGGAIAWNPVE